LQDGREEISAKVKPWRPINGKIIPIYHTMKLESAMEVKFHASLIIVVDEIIGELHTPATFKVPYL
jgi:hypothetical protein